MAPSSSTSSVRAGRARKGDITYIASHLSSSTQNIVQPTSRLSHIQHLHYDRQCHCLTICFFMSDLTNTQSGTIVRRAGLSTLRHNEAILTQSLTNCVFSSFQEKYPKKLFKFQPIVQIRSETFTLVNTPRAPKEVGIEYFPPSFLSSFQLLY